MTVRVNKALSKETLFSSAPIRKAVFSLAAPTVLSQLITVIYNMADTFFVGRLGDPLKVAAATVSMPLFMLLTAFANLFGIGGASLISRALGAGNKNRAARCSAFCIFGAAAVSLFFGVLIMIFENAVLPVLGADGETTEFASSYIFWTVGIGSLPTVMNPLLSHLMRAEGYSKQASFGIALGGILNMLLDPLFIFVFKMGITGAAVATLISNVIATAYFLLFIFVNRHILAVNFLPKNFTFGDKIPQEVISVGLPSFFISMMATVSNTVLNNIISSYENAAVAGMGIAKKIDLVAFAAAQGMTQGTLPLIGYNFSSGNKKRMHDSIKALFLMCLVVSLSAATALFFGAKAITACFINDAATVSYGQMFLKIICLACPTTALNFFAITVFQATGKKIQPIILSLLRKGSLDVLLMFVFNLLFGLSGVAWATPAADSVALIISAVLVVPYIKKL